MSTQATTARAAVRAYHQATKHHAHGYAPSPGFLDWDSQPDPFRRFSGAPFRALPLVRGQGRRSYDALFQDALTPADSLTPHSLGLFLELAFGLSAWKVDGPDRWSMRNVPSSGNLHPTEVYLILWQAAADELPPGLYHYTAHVHGLERRANLSPDVAKALASAHPGAFGALGLSSIIWREEWKYGARAYRYCQHDIGHAVAAASLAGGVAGWRVAVEFGAGDDAVAACLGLDRRADFTDAEPEHPDLLALIGPAPDDPPPVWTDIAAALTDWAGTASRQSAERVSWPQIAAVLPAIHKSSGVPVVASRPRAVAVGPGTQDACTLIRQRRSARRMDPKIALPRAAFEQMFSRTLGGGPLAVLPYDPAINLLLFVHGVDGLEPGLYLLNRAASLFDDFQMACANPDLSWQPVENTALPLVRLKTPWDMRRDVSKFSCHQGIAGRGAVSLGMIAPLGPVMAAEGAWAYRRLHWEAGAIGQVLYLEAEAAGLRGTGIGCFMDDEVHGLLGLGTAGDAPWQTLYHFTIGAAVEDARLVTEPAYAHLSGRCFE